MAAGKPRVLFACGCWVVLIPRGDGTYRLAAGYRSWASAIQLALWEAALMAGKARVHD